MKQVLYILIVTLILFSCKNTGGEKTNGIVADTIRGVFLSSTDKPAGGTDSAISWQDRLFIDLKVTPLQITKQEFDTYRKHYKPVCNLKALGLSVITTCNEICDTYLIETKSEKKLLLPSYYDSGFSNLLFSPSCDQFIIYASYDSPDYEKYYEHRAGIRVFGITKDPGLKAVKPAFKYDSNDWSIEDLTWINDAAIAVKVYEETRTEQGIGLRYAYYKVELK